MVPCTIQLALISVYMRVVVASWTSRHVLFTPLTLHDCSAWTLAGHRSLFHRRSHHDVTGLKKQLNAATAAIQGSGWGWLGYNPSTKKLEIVTTPNQDPLLCKLPLTLSPRARTTDDARSSAHVPIIGIDIWEHSYYLQYYNVKADVSAFLCLRVKLGFDDWCAVPQRNLERHQLRRGRGALC